MNKYHHSDQSDESLLLEYQSTGDKQQLGILLQRYTLLLLGVAMKYLKDKEMAADAVQQVFLKAITHIPNEPVQNFKGWLYVLMRNHCLQQLRDKHYLTEDNALYNIASDETANEDALWKDATIENLKAALDSLDREQRICIQLFYLEGMTYKKLMVHTGYSFDQVKSYIQNGKRNLRILLKKMER